MNIIGHAAAQFMQTFGLDWETAKFRVYCVDLDQCGPTPGAWKISNVGYVSEVVSGGTPATQYQRTITTAQPHGMLQNYQFGVVGVKNGVWPWVAGQTFYKGEYIRQPNAEGRRLLVHKGGSTNLVPDAWPEVDGTFLKMGGSLVLQAQGPFDRSPFNGVWNQRGVPTSTTTLWPEGLYPRNTAHPAGSFTDAYVIDLQRLFVSEIIPPAAINAMSDPIANAEVWYDGVIDCDDFTIDHSIASRSEAFCLVKVGDDPALPDNPTTNQRVMAWWTQQAGLPIAAGEGDVQFQVSSGGNRLMKI